MSNPTMATKHSSKRKSHTSLILNQKVDMIKLREGGMVKAKRAQKLASYTKQLAKLWMQK